MKKIILIACIVAFAALTPTAKAVIVPLVADGGDETTATEVGTVEVTVVGDNLVVTYSTFEGWPLIETHLHVSDDCIDGIPQTGAGNPKIGNFQYSDPVGDPTTQTYVIPLVVPPVLHPKNGKVLDPGHEWDDETICVAAHAVVGYGGDCSELALPTDVLMRVIYAGLESDSYFQEVTIQYPCPGDTPDPTILDGVHEGWCLDPDTGITNDQRYLGVPYLAHLPLPTSLTDLWPTAENLPMVIWLLNNTDLIGTASSCSPDPVWGGVNFTYGDFQNAMWGLLEDGAIFAPGDPGTYVLGQFDVCRTLELITLAMEHGDFVPDCGDYAGIILDTYYVGACPDLDATPSMRQPVLIPFLCECGDETAWGGIEIDPVGDPGDEDENGYGIDFPGSDWSMYFNFDVPAAD
ncbi:MAG: hypothetical protein ACYS3S_05140 [Planctomycetota bacterium]|jgi:hypothetical protein